MKLKKQRIAAVLVAAILFPALAMAQATTLQGVVEKVDKNKITVKTDSGVETVEIGSGTEGAQLTKEGDKVTIRANRSGEKLKAMSVNIVKNSSPRSAPSSNSSESSLLPGRSKAKPSASIK